ncbi:MAG TPA: protease pro-enzyme activation domain-containing protein, partial [Nitrososphaerales archaeon]|nr:protease pro-enzyme activation domain-containing protein [Nitrososphaerales archaeon]
MDPRKTTFFALSVLFLLTLSGSMGVALFSNSFSSAPQTNSFAPTPIPNPELNGTFVKIPISLPVKISQLGMQGAIDPITPLSLRLLISSRNPVGLEHYVNEVSSPLSPEFQQYLTPQKYAELYGSDPFEISSLISFLISKGLAAHMDPANPNLLLVSGKASSVESAFQVSLDRFQVANQSFFSPLTLPQLPSQFSFVQTIYGLSNYGAQANFASPMYVSGGRISGKPDQSDNNNIYYSPSELYQIYNSSSLHDAGYNGSGITIAIIDAYGDPYVQQELDNFSAQFNLPQVTLNQIC